MNKRILASIAVLAAIATGCQSDYEPNNEADFGIQQQALFGEIGEAPWASTPATQLTAKTVGSYMNFGRTLAIGYINSDNRPDIITSSGALVETGTIEIQYAGMSKYAYNMSTKVTGEDFGAALAVGSFCPELTPYDMIIASAPTYSSTFRGAFGAIYSTDGAIRNTKTRKIISNQTDFELAGTALTVGDLNGDGKYDLIYQSSPLDSSTYDYLNTKVSVVLDLCEQLAATSPVLNPDVVLDGKTQGFGSSLHVVDLDNSGSPELVVVDNLYASSGSTAAPEGAIHFYRYEGGNFVESRPAIVGAKGASIETVAFSDIDGDGDLDLIVGEPMYQTTKKREGRVRTYTNTGAGKAFDDTMVWSAVSDRSHARFGSEILVADINNDGVNDLIVGAPGQRPIGTEKAQAYVYVYLGTKDGSVFSKNAYWTYVSNVSTDKNDDFGRHIAAAQFDGKNWLDLIIAAPSAKFETVDYAGRIDIFNAVDGQCYTADKCLIDNVCYDAGHPLDGDDCTICNPEIDNFGWSTLTCDPSDNACAENVCINGKCEMQLFEDGTSCGENTCANNALTTQTCQAGACITENIDCGNYRCTSGSELACMTSCNNDSDCYIGSCQAGTCTLDTEGKPVIILADYPTSVMSGTTMELDASASYDPDGGEISLSWWSTDVNFDLKDSTSTSVITLTIPTVCEDENISIHVLATDDEGLTSQRDIIIKTIAEDCSNTDPSSRILVQSPQQNAVVARSNMAVSGNAEPETPVNVVIRSAEGTAYEASCSAIADSDGNWECSLADGMTTFPAGDYMITATSNVNGTPVSYDVNVHLAEDLITDEEGNLQGSCSIATTHNTPWFLALFGLMLVPLRRRQRS